MDTDYLLTATRSARRSLDLSTPVDPAEVRDCLQIGLQAANGTNQQLWRWIVVTDETRRKRLGKTYREAYLPSDGYVQTCLLPVGRLRAGHAFRPAARRPVDEVVAVDSFDGPPLGRNTPR